MSLKTILYAISQVMHSNLDADDSSWGQRMVAFNSSCLTLMRHMPVRALDFSETGVYLNADILTHRTQDELMLCSVYNEIQLGICITAPPFMKASSFLRYFRSMPGR